MPLQNFTCRPLVAGVGGNDKFTSDLGVASGVGLGVDVQAGAIKVGGVGIVGFKIAFSTGVDEAALAS